MISIILQLTQKRYGSSYAWPLNRILPWKKFFQVRKVLRSNGWNKKTMEEVRIDF